jgi:hypothetical protein
MKLCATTVHAAMARLPGGLLQFFLIWINSFQGGVRYTSKPAREVLFNTSAQTK